MTTREADCDKASEKPDDANRATVYLALGTNLGDREANLREAIRRITALGLVVTRRSSIYETEPVGFADQDWFLNQVIETQMPREVMFDLNEKKASQLTRDNEADGEPGLSDQLVGLLAALLRVEREMGRRRRLANGPRLIDIDILLCDEISGVFGNQRNDKEGHSLSVTDQSGDKNWPQLILPHPRLHLRRFVLAPLAEIAARVIHPTLQKSISELLAALDDPAVVRRYERCEPIG